MFHATRTFCITFPGSETHLAPNAPGIKTLVPLNATVATAATDREPDFVPSLPKVTFLTCFPRVIQDVHV